jgi:fructosamine-3-kinase
VSVTTDSPRLLVIAPFLKSSGRKSLFPSFCKTESQKIIKINRTMSFGISSILTEVLARSAGVEITSPLQFRATGGGSINNAYHITTSQHQQWFCKINEANRFPDLFVLERQGLALLGAAGMIRVPRVIACEVIAGKQVLVLEWIDQGLPSDDFWKTFGRQLAGLHQVTNTNFGLSTHNYMGALHQSNTPSPDWVEFFRDQRLQPQVKLAVDNGLMDAREVIRFQRLYKALDSIFEKEPPSLLHGDLWSGNFLCDEKSHPVLIDPAVYFGHRSMDLAMTTLFGGFEHSFYEAYAWHYPFPLNHRQQWDICNLYPLLIHLNLFGKRPSSGAPLSPSSPVTFASLGYLGDILSTIQRF